MTIHANIQRPIFIERLNQILSDADLPKMPSERAEVFAKIFDLDVITAERIIDGLTIPTESLLNAIADEFEVTPAWLSGQE
jgi:hypothetical protein